MNNKLKLIIACIYFFSIIIAISGLIFALNKIDDMDLNVNYSLDNNTLEAIKIIRNYNYTEYIENNSNTLEAIKIIRNYNYTEYIENNSDCECLCKVLRYNLENNTFEEIKHD